MTGEDKKGGSAAKANNTTTTTTTTDLTCDNNVTTTTTAACNNNMSNGDASSNNHNNHHNHQNGNVDKTAPVAPGTNVETLPRTGKQGEPSTLFLRAARAGQLEKVLEYLDSGVDINTSNANGLNALHLAAKDGHLEIVKELLLRGAIVDAATKKGNTALHIASLAGQEEVVHLLVQRGASVNAQSQNGFTPLYMAAQENHDSVVKFLLNKGANQTLATEDGFTPLAVAMQQGHDKVVAVLLENDTRGKVRLPALHIAAKKDDCKAAALLLQNDHNPDVTSKSGFTPLHIAAHYGNDRIASLLYDKGADINFAAKHNITPMHVAAKWGKIKMVNLLMSKGANIEAKTRDGLTPLHCAARSGHHEVVDILIEKGAPIGSKTKNGLAPLHMASQGDHVDAARILLYHRAPVDEVTVDYLTALHVAAHCGHVRVAKLLLDRNADPNARALNGFTPLHIACKKNRIKVVELLLKHKASIEATTESGLTPLHVASFMGCMNIVIYLLQHEASPDIPTVRGETPLHLAARANQTDIIRILLRNGAQVDARAREEQTPLHVASRLGNVDIVMLLLQHGASVDVTTKDLYTPLHIAAKEGQEEVASVLLENGASLTSVTKKGFTPLHLAAKYGNMNVARLLLQKNAPVDAQGKNGVTPLHVASHYDHQNVALLLLDKGASPHAMAKNGHTPLHIAARKNQMDIATTLLEYGARANADSKAGFTPLHLSAQEGHTDMSTLLIEHKADTNQNAKNGLTPLHLCAQEDKVNVASILVKNGAQVNAKTKAGYTPLHVASHFGQAAMVRFLLSSGATVEKRTNAGYTPLHQAAQQGHTLVINLLLESKAQPNSVTNNGQTALDIAQKLGYITVVETLKIVTETVITTTHTVTIEEKYKVQAPESMQETFMSDSEDEGGGDEIGTTAMNVYAGKAPHAQHVYLPSYYQGQMTYTREDPMLSDQQQYRYMTVDDMKSMGDDSMRVNVTDDERDNRHSGAPTITEMITKESYNRQNAANHKPDNVDINRGHPVHVGIPSWKNFLVSFLVDARGGAMRGCRHSGVRVIVPPRKATMPMRVTCRYLKRDKLTNPPPLMEGEALASRILELGPVGAKFLGPVIIEVPHFASLRGKEREIVILRSDNGETWREHTLEASEEAVQDVLNESFEGEELSQLEDLQTSRIVRILTVDFPHYFAVVSRIRQEVHAVGPEGGTVSSTAVPQVQAIFPAAALTKKIRVGLQAHPIPAELVAKLLGNRVAVSPIVTVEPRRRKFHKPIILTIPVPQAANKGMINQYSGDAPTLRLLCSITGGQLRAVWEDVTGSTPLSFVKDCVSFTTTVSARFWLMDCRNVSEATKMATELYTHATHVPFMAKFVVFAKRTDPLEARLRVFCMTDDKEDKTLEHQEHFTEVAKSRDVEVLEGKTQFMEFAGNLVPVLKSGEQLQLPFRGFKENRVPFTVRVRDPDAQDTMGRIMFMSEPKKAKGEPPQTPICTLNIMLPEKIIPDGGSSELDLLELSKNYSFLRDGGLSRPDAIHRATIRLTDIANLLDKDWEKLAQELNITPNEIAQIKENHPDLPAQQATAMFKAWQANGNKATGNTLEKALNKIGREDIVKTCIFNVELVTDDVEKAVARVRLDQPGFDTFKDELGPSRNTSLQRDATLEPKAELEYEEPDRMKDSESVEDLSTTGGSQKTTAKQHGTITNGTIYNATSTPIKDKYASDEKELGDMMADFIEHKLHASETMVKNSREDIDDDNKKRQRVLEDANRIVSGVKQDAEKEMNKLAKEGWSVVSDDEEKKLNEVQNALSLKKSDALEGAASNILEPPIIQQKCIIGTDGDRTITTITTKTIITTGRDVKTEKDADTGYDTTDFTRPLGIVSIQEIEVEAGEKFKPVVSKIENTKSDDDRRIHTLPGNKEKVSNERKEEDETLQDNESKFPDDLNDGKKTKDKSSKIFAGIFKSPKNKKDKPKDSSEISFDIVDKSTKASTIQLLDEMKKSADATIEDDIKYASTLQDVELNKDDMASKESEKNISNEKLSKDNSRLFGILKSPKSKNKTKKLSKTESSADAPFTSSEENDRKTKSHSTHQTVNSDNSFYEIDLIDADGPNEKETNRDDEVVLKKEIEINKNESHNAKQEKIGVFSKMFQKSPKTKDKKSSTSRESSVTKDVPVASGDESKMSPNVIEKSSIFVETDLKKVTQQFLEDSINTAGIIDACPYKSEYLYKTTTSTTANIDEEVHAEKSLKIEMKNEEPSKGKDKTDGFLSGIFKGAKHASDEVVDEVKKFVKDTKKEAMEEEEKAKNLTSKMKKNIDDAELNILHKTNEVKKDVKDDVNETKQKLEKITIETTTELVDGIHEKMDDDTAKAKEITKESLKDEIIKIETNVTKSKEKKSKFLTGIFKGSKSVSEDEEKTEYELNKDAKKKKEESSVIIDEKRKNINLESEASNDGPTVSTTEVIKTEKELNVRDSIETPEKSKQKTSRFFSGVFSTPNTSNEEAAKDVKEYIGESKRSFKKQKNKLHKKPAKDDVKLQSHEANTNINETIDDLDKVVQNEGLIVKIVDGNDSNLTVKDEKLKKDSEEEMTPSRDHVSEPTKKSKDKAGGFLSGIFKGAKHATDEITDELKEFVEETKKEAIEEEEKVKKSSEKVKKDVKDHADAISQEMDKLTAQVVVKTEASVDSVQQVIDETSNEKEKLEKKVDSDAKTAVDHADVAVKKSKDKVSGFLSGILKSSKHTSNEVVEEVEEFLEKTKKEADEEKQNSKNKIDDINEELSSRKILNITDGSENISENTSNFDSEMTPTKTSAKIQKSKEKTGGFLSGIFKHTKHSGNELSENKSELVKEVQGKSFDENEKLKEASSDIKQESKKLVDTASENENKTLLLGQQKTGDLEKETTQISIPANAAPQVNLDKVHDTIQEKIESIKKPTEEVETIMNSAETAAKKGKEKTGGFLSGFFKGNTSTEASGDVKAVVSKQPTEEIEEIRQLSHDVEKEADFLIEDSDKVLDSVIMSFTETTTTSNNTNNPSTSIDNYEELSEKLYFEGKGIVNLSAVKVEKTTVIVSEGIKNVENVTSKETKTAKLKAESDVKNAIDPSADSIKKNKDKVSGFLSGMFKNSKSTSDQVAEDVQQFLDTTKREIQEERKIMIQTIDETKVDSQISSTDLKMKTEPREDLETKTEKEISEKQKKSKEKVGGFFSGIFKGTKSSSEDPTNQMKELIEEKILTETKIENESDNATQNTDVISNLNKDELNEHTISITTVPQIISVTDNEQETGHLSDNEKSKKVTKDESAKKGKNKSGFLTGILKSAKDAADDVVEDVKEFFEETKSEAINEEADKSEGKKNLNTPNLSDSASENLISKDDAEKTNETKKKKEKVGLLGGILKKSEESNKSTRHVSKNKKNDSRDMDSTEDKEDQVTEISDCEEKSMKTAEEKPSFLGNIFKNSKKSTKEVLDHEKESSDKMNEVVLKEIEMDPKQFEEMKKDSKTMLPTVTINLSSTKSSNVDRPAKEKNDAEVITQDPSDKSTKFTEESSIKSKNKSGGFLSGIFKGAKHATDEITDELKEFVEETKKEAIEEEEKVKKSSEKVKKDVKDHADAISQEIDKLTAQVVVKTEASVDSVQQVIDETSNEKEKLEKKVDSDAKTAVDHADVAVKKSKDKVAGFLSGILKSSKHTSNEVVEEVEEFLEKTKKEADEEKQNKLEETSKTKKELERTTLPHIASSDKKISSITADVSSNVESIPQEIQDLKNDDLTVASVKKSKDKTAGFFSGIFKGGKHAADELTSETKGYTKEIEIEALNEEEKAKRLETKVTKNTDALVSASKNVDKTLSNISDSTAIIEDDTKKEEIETSKEIKDPKREDSIKKSKDKTGGFLSGIFKGAKRAADDLAGEMQEFVEETEKEALDEEEKAKRSATNIKKEAGDLVVSASKHVDKVATDMLETTTEIVDDVKQLDIETSEKIDKLKKKTSSDLKSAGDSINATAKKSKDKSSGFFSGILKGSKHVSDEVVEDVQTFIEKTKKETEEEKQNILKETHEAACELEKNVTKTSDNVAEKSSFLIKDVSRAKDTISKEIDDTEDKINKQTEKVTESVNESTKKAKDKTTGFFSGIFKGVKHAADTVADEEKELVEEIEKKGLEEKEKAINVTEKYQKEVTDLTIASSKSQEKTLDYLTDTAIDVADNIEKVYSETLADTQKLRKKTKSEKKLASDSFDGMSKKGKDKVSGFLSGILKTSKDAPQVISSDVEGTMAKKMIGESNKNENPSEISKVDETDEENPDLSKHDKSSEKSSLIEIKNQSGKEMADSIESTKNANDDSFETSNNASVSDSSKRGKDKTGGFLSGIFKGAKRAADDLAGEMHEFIEETEREALDEEEKAKRSATNVKKEAGDLVVSASKHVDKAATDMLEATTEIVDDAKQLDIETSEKIDKLKKKTSSDLKSAGDSINTTAKKSKDKSSGFFSGILKGSKHVSDEVVEDVQTFIEKTKKETEEEKQNILKETHEAACELEKNVTKTSDNVAEKTSSLIKDVSRAKDTISKEIDDTEDKINKQTEKVTESVNESTKKAKDKTTGFFSGIFKSSKHSTDEVADEAKELLKETDKEAHEIESKIEKSLGEIENPFLTVENVNTSEIIPDDGDLKLKFCDTEKPKNEIFTDAKYTQSEGQKVSQASVDSVKTLTKNEKPKAGRFFSGMFKSNANEEIEKSKEVTLETQDKSEQLTDSAVTSSHLDQTLEDLEQKVNPDENIKADVSIMTTSSTDMMPKKRKEKTVGFLSGLFKGAKHAVDEVADEMKEFVEETKLNELEEEKKMKKDVAKSIDATSELVHSVSKNAEETSSLVIEKMDSAEGNIRKMTEEISTNANDLNNKLESDVKTVTHSANSSINKSKDKASGLLSGIFKGSKRASEESSDNSKVNISGEKNKSQKEIDSVVENVGQSSVPRTTEVKTILSESVSDTLSSPEVSEPSSRKSSSKTGGFLSSILKGPKQEKSSTQQIDEKEKTTTSQNVQSLSKIDEDTLIHTKKEVSEESKQVDSSTIFKKSIVEVTTIITESETVLEKNVYEKSSEISSVIPQLKHSSESESSRVISSSKTESSEIIRKSPADEEKTTIDESKIDAPNAYKTDRFNADDVKAVTSDFLQDSRDFALKIDDKMPESSLEPVDSSSSEPSSARNSLERDTTSKDKSKKNKKSKKPGVISNLIKKTKGATHKIAKEVDHATDSIKDATGKFWEDTKRESKDSKPFGSYDVNPSTENREKVRDEVALESDIMLGSSSPIDNTKPVTSINIEESRLPHEVVSYQEKDNSSVQITQKSVTVIASEVSSNLMHSDPVSHQTVTTVITKSVCTGTTPPPDPADFSNNKSKDITEEATKRAQILADMKQAENDFLQQGDPTYIETTTTEINPDTSERITKVTQTITTSVAEDGSSSGGDGLQKIVDQFMSEERKGNQ
ncbi:ankyrin-2-like isoform X2 [Trichogramma pretiosum]|uniref:ankyrin-2-like isoform X2 n=1 Tax=Trichogramma pretiosum TaxID=7493 RepID=UPI000C71B4E7|nr:ankyrin-2-like isoform X2 [Trichogramma pretiosum]